MNKRVAFVFPGQGSQSVGMLAQIAERYPIIESTFQEASKILDEDLWQITQTGPVEKLNLTVYTQPALVAASVSLWRLWQTKRGATPALLAGHSVGEYSALVCSGAISFDEGIKLVAKRAELMQEAVPEGQGGMLAILGMTDEQILSLCDKASQDQVLMPANFNAIGQVVLAGESSAIDRALALAKSEGAKLAKRLPMSVPSHCSLLKEAAVALGKYLEQVPLTSPSIPVINNVDVTMLNHPDDIRDALVRQLYNPVRWVESIEFFSQEGISEIYEMGPGKILTKLLPRINKNLIGIACGELSQWEKFASL